MPDYKSAALSSTQRTTRIVALLLLPLLSLSGVAKAESPAEPHATPQGATELKIYKQRFEITANVLCRVYERRPTYCTAHVNAPLSDAIHPEMILKYSAVKLDDKEFDVQTTEDANIKFRTDKTNYTGQQKLEVDVVYIK